MAPAGPLLDRSLLLAASGLIATRVTDGLAGLEDSPDLYAGRLGAALFLAAQASVAKDESLRGTAVRIAEEIASSASAESGLGRTGIGGFVGLGGTIYALTKIAQFTGEKALVDSARHLATRLTSETIECDRSLDVVHGAAGALLALLALPNPAEALGVGGSAIDRAELCALHLLRSRRRVDESTWAWISGDHPAPRSGFAHGAAGIAVAFARLYQHRPRPEWLQAVFEALDFLRAHYDPTLDNWTPSASDKHVSSLGWCHGAPGVALAHLSITGDLTAADLTAAAAERKGRSAEFEHDLQRALAACANHPPTPLDHLCCGNMSRTETFLVAHRYFGDRASLAYFHRFARWVLRSAKTHGRFVVPQNPSTPLSFFQGLPGIGYSFLRIVEPRRLPCVLLME